MRSETNSTRGLDASVAAAPDRAPAASIGHLDEDYSRVVFRGCEAFYRVNAFSRAQGFALLTRRSRERQKGGAGVHARDRERAIKCKRASQPHLVHGDLGSSQSGPESEGEGGNEEGREGRLRHVSTTASWVVQNGKTGRISINLVSPRTHTTRQIQPNGPNVPAASVQMHTRACILSMGTCDSFWKEVKSCGRVHASCFGGDGGAAVR